MDNALYANVAKYAAKRGMSIRQVELKAGLGNGTIGKWRTAEPSIKNIKAVAATLGVAVSTLLKETE